MRIWGAAGVAGVMTGVVLITGDFSSYAFLVVPVILGWMLAAGVSLLRQLRAVHKSDHSVSTEAQKKLA